MSDKERVAATKKTLLDAKDMAIAAAQAACALVALAAMIPQMTAPAASICAACKVAAAPMAAASGGGSSNEQAGAPALRRQQDSREHVQAQQGLVAQLKEEIKQLVQQEDYSAASAKKKVLEAAQQVLEKMGACSASGTCTATDRKGAGWAARFGFGGSGGTGDGVKTEPSPETGGEKAGAPQETGNKEGEDQTEEASSAQEGGGAPLLKPI